MNDRNRVEPLEDRAQWSAWATYTPTWSASTPPAIGNGSVTGRYRRIGTLGFLNGVIQIGTTTTFGSGFWTLSLPSGWTARTLTNGYQFGLIYMVPAAGNAYQGVCWAASASTVLRFDTNAGTGTTVAVDASNPVAWTQSASNWLSFNITIELAS